MTTWILTGKIPWAHLKEIRDYYTRLDQLEAETQSPTGRDHKED